NYIPAIADLGISKLIDASSNENAINGVIPYVTLEVLKEGNIFNSFCPEIPIDIPHELVKLMKRCWDPDPENRIIK
ncbi:30514_t:CDS:2, partial [Racocetra persica]